MLNILFQD